MDLSDDLRSRAEAWIAGDPDEATRGELQALLDGGDAEQLGARLDGALAFGTAGIRGVVGAGPLRMNRAVVIRTTRGLADHLVDAHGGGAVVVGHDARPDSERFAADASGVLAAAGLEVHAFSGIVPTPLVAFAAKELDAVAAVVVTASHNPPEYNGYKVYDHRAVQIVPPTDVAIAGAIDTTAPAADIPRREADRAAEVDGATTLGDEWLDRYTERVLSERVDADRAPLRIAYTPLHGVGGRALERVLTAAGYDVHTVPSQRDPDGAFPTVRFPNPEEAGALDAALDLAREIDADLVLANDPDADRLAVAIPRAEGWTPLDGNRIGVLLADHLLRHGAGGDRLVVNSIVSTPMAALVAAAYGARHEVSLTGFKWICNAALDLREQGFRLALGFEEALGYCVGEVVNDKDGINAALTFADFVAELRAAGSTVVERQEELDALHGRWISAPASVTLDGAEGAARIAAAMQRIGEDRAPTELGGREVLGVTDLRDGGGQRPRWLPEDDVVVLDLEGGRAIIRPSGTEPKLKLYVDLRGEAGAASERLRTEAERVGAALLAFVGLAT